MEPAWDERPILGRSRGLPWWGAVLLAFGLALVAAVIDIKRLDTLGKIYQGAYVLGCVGAVCLVRRRNLFGPIVQPPLVFAVTAVGSVLAFAPSAKTGGGIKSALLAVALPLTSNFPTMAITTGVVVLIGVGRLFLQRNPKARTTRSRRPDADDDRPSRRPLVDEDARGSEPDPFDEVPPRRPAERRPTPRTPDPRSSRDGAPRSRETPPRPRDGGARPSREGDRPRRPSGDDPRRDPGSTPKRQPPPRRPRPEDR